VKDKKTMEYTIPLKRVYWGRRRNRAARAVRLVREFAARHFGVENVLISEGVNKLIWSNGIEKPPRRIRVKIVEKGEEEEKRVYVLLPDEEPPEEEE
jgi:large subunit ribosomal protein L31e